MSDDDHLRDDPTLPRGREWDAGVDEEAIEDRRRTPIMRPLFPDDGGYDDSLWEDM